MVALLRWASFLRKKAPIKNLARPVGITASPFEEKAKEAGLYARSFNGDAFSSEMKEQVIAAIKEDLGQVDMVVYSLASPRRTDPTDGETYRSVLKPTGDTYTQHTLNTDKGLVEEISIESATEQEIADTVKVMGGEDWKMWIDAMKDAGVPRR